MIKNSTRLRLILWVAAAILGAVLADLKEGMKLMDVIRTSVGALLAGVLAARTYMDQSLARSPEKPTVPQETTSE